jgi:hypothetical protein
MKQRRYENPTAQDARNWCDELGIKLRPMNGILRKIVPPGKTVPLELMLALQQHESELMTMVTPRHGLAAVPTHVDPETGEVLSDLPQIAADNRDVPDVTQQAWTALTDANDPPHLFRYASAMSRLEKEDGRAVMRPLTEKRMSYELARVADWFIMKKGGPEPAVPPLHVVNDMLATPEPPLPIVERMTHAPYFSPDRRLITAEGYDEASRTLLFLDSSLHIPPVPEQPTAEDIQRARTLILDELFADFPFVSEADRANAVALFLLPYARQMVSGPTPNHLIESPTAGSGKGLLADAATRPAIGTHVGVITGARDDDEWRKRLSAKLREGAPVILIDNVTRVIDSGSFASAITADIWTDRVLGTNETMKVPVRAVWVTTANNPTMTTEIARRTIRIRLDPKQDRPWQRKGFRYKNLIAWVDEHRADLIHAALVLIQTWIAAGKPTGNVTLGSFERWATVMGGILATAGIKGFLNNLDEFYEAADLEGAIWREFVAIWWAEHNQKEVSVKDLFALTDGVEGFDFGKGNEKAQRTAFGMQLAKQRDRVIGEHRIVFTRIEHKAKLWRLIPRTIDPLIPTAPGNEGNLPEKGSPPDSVGHTREKGQGGEPQGTNFNPVPVDNSFSLTRSAGDRFPMVPIPTDEAFPGKGRPEGNLQDKGSPPDRDMLIEWAENVALGSDDEQPIPDEIRKAAQRFGFLVDAFGVASEEAKRLLNHLKGA